MCWLYAITKYGYVIGLEDVFRAIEDARRLGFTLFEIEGVGKQLHSVAKNRATIKNRCDEAGLKIVNFVPVLPDLASEDEGKRKVALANFELGCEIASFLDADMVELDTYYPPLYVVKPYDISREFTYAYEPPKMKVDPSFDFWRYFNDVVVDSVATCNDQAAAHGLRLCIEPRVWETTSNVWSLEVLFREIHSSNLGAVFETAHLTCQRTPLVQAVEMLGKRIFYVHASDSDVRSEDHLEIGRGVIDWVTLLKALAKQQFDGVFGLDIGGNSRMRDTLDGLYTRSRTYLENAIAKNVG
jgi:sugar phosphate isomerase/epimerase